MSSCWACGAGLPAPFYEVESVPVSSCVLLPSRDAALEYPTGDLALSMCSRCGFIQNTRFAAERVDYTQPYEESQAFSPTYRDFARALAAGLVERYDLVGRTVFEIGCGKADFLALICELGNNRGLGIDPAFDSSRLDTTADVKVIKGFFDAETTHLTGDFIVCRHTLEHLDRVEEFLSLVRESAVRTEGAGVYFEVPDVRRVLREGAFWDVYYEHCSYFTIETLTHLFRSVGFDVESAKLGFDDQYVLLEAFPASDTQPVHRPASVISGLESDVATFIDRVSARTSRWRSTLEEASKAGLAVAIWGASSKGVAFLNALGITSEVAFAVDINPFKQGRFLPRTGHEIMAPTALTELALDLVIAMNPIYVEEIRSMLERLGLNPRILAV